MPQNPIRFPVPNVNEINHNRLGGPPLQAHGNLTYIEFITVVKSLWENAYPMIKIKPSQSGDYAEYPVIIYGLELKRAHSVEPKPKTRISPQEGIAIYGQRFQNIISFSIITKAESAKEKGAIARYSGAEAADKIMETFEDFMLEHTPVFKRLGASEFIYARRLSDTEENRETTDTCKRTVTYMLTTEKLLGMEVERIEKIAVDVRRYMAYEKEIWDSFYDFNHSSTPSYEGTEVNIIDLYQTATPNT